MNFGVYKNKKILITGHTGFKGSWLAIWLKSLGAKVFGVAFDPPTSPSHFLVTGISKVIDDQRIDIRNKDILKEFIIKTNPDFVFHLAAQALVKKSHDDPVETYLTNTIGTLNILEALRYLKNKCVAVLITSDKCYNNLEWVWGYRETDPLGGLDPYSASKGAAELVIRSHISSFFPIDGKIRIGICRAGNVIGGGDWAKDRIVPDCVRSWAIGESVNLRNPNATRPWQHVLEPLSGYLTLGAELSQRKELHGEPFNFGPSANQNHTVLELVQSMSRYWDKVRWTEDGKDEKQPYESKLLKLNCDKALHLLNWGTALDFQETVRMTAMWYYSYYNDPSKILDLSLSNIREYETILQNSDLP